MLLGMSHVSSWHRTTIVALLVLPGAACGRRSPATVPDGDPKQGAILLSAHGCGACHTIPGVSAATGTIGPPLGGFARRVYLAGKLPNQLDHLIRWIRAPQSIEPGTAMPNLPVNEAEARAMATYLYTLR
jgi:cytochrome c